MQDTACKCIEVNTRKTDALKAIIYDEVTVDFSKRWYPPALKKYYSPSRNKMYGKIWCVLV